MEAGNTLESDSRQGRSGSAGALWTSHTFQRHYATDNYSNHRRTMCQFVSAQVTWRRWIFYVRPR
jgi:hypothetical protein